MRKAGVGAGLTPMLPEAMNGFDWRRLAVA